MVKLTRKQDPRITAAAIAPDDLDDVIFKWILDRLDELVAEADAGIC